MVSISEAENVTKIISSDVLQFEQISSAENGQDQGVKAIHYIHLHWLGDTPQNCYEYITTFCNQIYHKPNYGSETEGSPTSDHSSTIEMTIPNNVEEVWTTGLFDCLENQTNAAVTPVLPCITFGQIAETLDSGETGCPTGSFIYAAMMPVLCSQWIMGSKYRAKLRRKFHLVEAPYDDWASHLFCPCCSLCQEYRELQIRGLDPSIGWKGILARQQAIQQRPQDPLQCPPQSQAMSI